MQHLFSLNKFPVFLTLTGMIVAFQLYIFSLPFFHFGIWPQAETASLAFYACALICSLGLLLLSFVNPRLILRLLFHPVVFWLLAIGMLSLLDVAFQSLKARHVLGSVRLSEGATWWLNWAIFTAALLLLLRYKTPKFLLMLAAFVGFAGAYILTLGYAFFKTLYTPFYFTDYLAISVTSLFPVLYYYYFKPVGREKPQWWLWAGFYVVMLGALYLTQNLVGVAYGLLGVAFFIFLYQWKKLPSGLSDKLGVSAVVAIPPFIMLIALAFLQLDVTSGFYAFTDNPYVQNIVSRAYLINVVLQAMMDQPLSFLTGLGWGTFPEQIVNHLPLQWVNLTIDSGQWDGLVTDHFHTHNIYFEILYSVGLFGLLALLAYSVSLVAFARRSKRIGGVIVAGGFVSIGSFWFFFPLNIPFIALGAAFFTRSARIFSFNGNSLWIKSLIRMLLFIVLLVQGISIYWSYNTTFSAMKTMDQTLKPEELQRGCSLSFNDYGAGGIHLSRMIMNRLRFVVYTVYEQNDSEESKKSMSSIPEHLEHINYFFCQAQAYKKAYTASARLRLASLMVRNEILIGLAEQLDSQTREYYYAGWKEELKEWLKDYPRRSDLAVPFLLWHFNQGLESDAYDIARDIYNVNKEDPIGLWFYGLFLTADASQAKRGVSLMQKSIRNGVERFIPIEPELKDQLLGTIPSSE